jgi:predicted membrane-bound spermidine synthase
MPDHHKHSLSKGTSLFVLFAEGFVSLSLQITIMRQLVPFIGNSMVNVSIVIAMFLTALSLGYWIGGNKNKNPLQSLSRNIILAAALVSFGFSYTVMDYFFNYFESITSNNLISLFVYLSIFLMPVVFLLGQTIPLLTNFIKNESVSELTGRSLSLNTVGSVLGSVVTSLVLFYYLGMAATVFVNVLLLIFIYFIVYNGKKLNALTLSISILLTAFYLNVILETKVFVKTTAYTNYEIESRENEMFKILKMNKSISSVTFNGGTYGYIAGIRKQINKDLNIKDSKILVLGAGGFTLSLGDTTNNQYEYIDIDPAIKDVVEKFFLKQGINGKFIAEDARTYVKNTQKKYQVIVVDLYTNKNSIPWHVMTKEFMESVNNALTNNGHVIMNIVQRDDFGDDVSKRLHNTIMDTYNFCYVIPYDNKTELMNVTYNCKKQKRKSFNEIYIDNIERY